MNVYAAWVNVSSLKIPVYNDLTTRSDGTPGAGGDIIGRIYPNEFYCTYPRSSTAQNVDYISIVFRNSDGYMSSGYIESQPGGLATGYESWYASQSHYVNYNSNGYSLVPSVSETIDGTSYRVFTVNAEATYRRPNGYYLGMLPVGTKIATYESTTGQSYRSYMVFHKKTS